MIDTLTIGVDVGGTRTKYGLVNTTTGEVLQIIIQQTEKTNAGIFLQQVDMVVKTFRIVAEKSGNTIGGIGFGIPGFINGEAIIETTYGFLGFMENYPLKTIMEDHHEIPCFLDNDARTVSLGEALYGKGKNYNRVLTLTLGTGVGFGLVVNGRFTERLPLAHMAGHMQISNEGDECYCGKKGCLEALVSSKGIIKLAAASNLKGNLSVENIFDRALRGDPGAAMVLNKITTYLHIAIHNYINLFAPEIIVLGGGIAKGLSPYVEKIKGKNYLSPHPNYKFQLLVSELEESAGMLGSAALIKHINQPS